MKITTLRLSNFQSFGPGPTILDLEDLTYILGPNGAGKTAVLQALTRLFSPQQSQRRIRRDDFHVRTSDTELAEPAYPHLWLEVDMEFPEAMDEENQHAAIAPNFIHMVITTVDAVPRARVRLSASIAADGEIDEKIEYILEADEAGEPVRRSEMSRHERAMVEVHYLPARRDPADHISYTAASLLGRVLRAADWTTQRETLSQLAGDVSDSIAQNSAVATYGEQLNKEWTGLHRGTFFREPALGFGSDDIEGVLRQLTLTFSPTHDGAKLPFDRLSDGQKSLLYISMVLAWQSLARRVLSGEETSLQPDRLRPPVHTILALEEPENSLAPQYLGRIGRQLREGSEFGDVQCLIATHAPTLLRRVPPSSIRFLRLNPHRETVVHRILLPDEDVETAKYVREAVRAYPELYFARFVVLGEGDSEQVVLPRVLEAAGIAEDDASVCVVPLGGRHVNHFWRLLNELQIPHATLLDLDAGRYQAGWGRVKNALKQINKINPGTYEAVSIEQLPKWNEDRDFPSFHDPHCKDGRGPVRSLEERGVFFSEPVDLDLMLLRAYPAAYGVATSLVDASKAPSPETVVSVLGKSHANMHHLPDDVIGLFDSYHAKFDLGSKPSEHLSALANLSNRDLVDHLPSVLTRLVEYVRSKIEGLPE